MRTSHEIRTVEEFRGLTSQPVGVVVVTDTASETKAHRTTCPRVTEKHFRTDAVVGGSKNGRYFVCLRYDDAAAETSSRWCDICRDRGG